jgi:hypothetical protein
MDYLPAIPAFDFRNHGPLAALDPHLAAFGERSRKRKVPGRRLSTLSVERIVSLQPSTRPGSVRSPVSVYPCLPIHPDERLVRASLLESGRPSVQKRRSLLPDRQQIGDLSPSIEAFRTDGQIQVIGVSMRPHLKLDRTTASRY